MIKRAGLALLLALSACQSSSPPAAQSAEAAKAGVTLFPASGAPNVNPDTQLRLTFSAPPKIGTSGLIRIYDAADNSLVDQIDMSIPPSLNPNGRSTASTEAERVAQGRDTKMSDYQVNTIAGVDFHFFPIIVRGNTAT